MRNEILKALKNYRDNRAELDEIQWQLRESEVQDAVQSAAKFPYSKHTITIQGVPDTVYVIRLGTRAAELRSQIRTADRFVKGLPFRIKKAVKLKYMEDIPERMTWEKVADEIGCGETASSLKNKLFRFLNCATNETHKTN